MNAKNGFLAPENLAIPNSVQIGQHLWFVFVLNYMGNLLQSTAISKKLDRFGLHLVWQGFLGRPIHFAKKVPVVWFELGKKERKCGTVLHSNEFNFMLGQY